MTLPIKPDKETHIIFLRHGTVHNPQNIYYGRLPRYRLSYTGRKEACTASHALRDRPLSALYTSPMLRARQTAEIIAAPHENVRVSTSRLINEVHSPFDGWDRDVLDERAWDIYSGAGPEFEQPADVLQRITAFVRHVRRRYYGQQVAVVTHGDIISFLILWASNLPVTQQQKRRLDECGIPGGYPAPASLTELIYRSRNSDNPPALLYRDPAAMRTFQ